MAGVEEVEAAVGEDHPLLGAMGRLKRRMASFKERTGWFKGFALGGVRRASLTLWALEAWRDSMSFGS